MLWIFSATGQTSKTLVHLLPYIQMLRGWLRLKRPRVTHGRWLGVTTFRREALVPVSPTIAPRPSPPVLYISFDWFRSRAAPFPSSPCSWSFQSNISSSIEIRKEFAASFWLSKSLYFRQTTGSLPSGLSERFPLFFYASKDKRWPRSYYFHLLLWQPIVLALVWRLGFVMVHSNLVILTLLFPWLVDVLERQHQTVQFLPFLAGPRWERGICHWRRRVFERHLESFGVVPMHVQTSGMNSYLLHRKPPSPSSGSMAFSHKWSSSTMRPALQISASVKPLSAICTSDILFGFPFCKVHVVIA